MNGIQSDQMKNKRDDKYDGTFSLCCLVSLLKCSESRFAWNKSSSVIILSQHISHHMPPIYPKLLPKFSPSKTGHVLIRIQGTERHILRRIKHLNACLLQLSPTCARSGENWEFQEPLLVTTAAGLEKCREVEVYIIKYGFIARSPFLWDLLFTDF